MSFTRAKAHASASVWSKPGCPGSDECLHEMQPAHAVENRSAVKNGSLALAGTGMELEDIVWSEIGEAQKEKDSSLAVESLKS